MNHRLGVFSQVYALSMPPRGGPVLCISLRPQDITVPSPPALNPQPSRCIHTLTAVFLYNTRTGTVQIRYVLLVRPDRHSRPATLRHRRRRSSRRIL